MSQLTQLSDFSAEVFTDIAAADTRSREAGLGGVDVNRWLEQQAEEGSIASSLVSNREETVKRFGKPLSPIRQIMAASGIQFLGKDSASAAVFFPRAGNSMYKKGAEFLMHALAGEIFSGVIQGSGIEHEIMAAQGSFGTTTSAVGDVLYPTELRRNIVDETINPFDNPNTVRLADLVSSGTTIQGDSYKQPVLENQDIEYYEFGRVAEFGEIPLYIVELAERNVRVYKRGGGFGYSYEVARRQSINQFAIVVMWFALAKEAQLIKDAITIMLNGDGNANSGAVDFAGVASPTIQNWREYMRSIEYDYSMGFNYAMGDPTEVNIIDALRYPVVNLEMTPDQREMYRTGNLRTPGGQILRQAVKGSVLDSSQKTLFWNSSRALEQATEAGSVIQEAERMVRTQQEAVYMTYNTGFSKLNRNSVHSYTRA